MTNPKVTPQDVEGSIAEEYYFTAAEGVGPLPAGHPLSMITFCVLVTENRHTVVGVAYCANPETFDAQVGRDWARKEAIDNLYPMVVYAARDASLHEENPQRKP